MKRLHSRGFTIIELMIATIIFSLVLLIVTGAIIQFTRIYYKGLITGKTQEVARTIAEDMARSAQFSETGVQPGTDCYIFGSQQYKFQTNTPKDASNYAFLVGSKTSCDTLPDNPVELMGENMQVRYVNVEPNPSTDSITITVIVGHGTDIQPDNTCPAISLGGQFCAVSTIETTVSTR